MRSRTLRSLQALVAITAVFVLTGAKGDGCGGGGDDGDGDGGEPPPPPPCDPGFHLETICDDSCGQCFEQCVPDTPCPDGTYEQWTCYDDMPVYECEDGTDCAPPPQDNCFLECVPLDPCGPGFHEEWVCEGWDPDGQQDPDMPPPPDQCYPICVPDGPCGPGEVEEWICEDYEWGGGCYPICVPQGPCGPGEHEELICQGPGSCEHDKCVEGPALSPDCDPAVALICSVDPFCCDAYWDSICVMEVESVAGEQCGDPNDDYPPPPEECQIVCVPDEPMCPPGHHLEEVCYGGDDGDPIGCELICVPDDYEQLPD